jgi:hypothetical protein
LQGCDGVIVLAGSVDSTEAALVPPLMHAVPGVAGVESELVGEVRIPAADGPTSIAVSVPRERDPMDGWWMTRQRIDHARAPADQVTAGA